MTVSPTPVHTPLYNVTLYHYSHQEKSLKSELTCFDRNNSVEVRLLLTLWHIASRAPLKQTSLADWKLRGNEEN
jgi:hypothetical protein